MDSTDCVFCIYYRADGIQNPKCLHHKIELPQDASGRPLDPYMTCKDWTFKHGARPQQFVATLDWLKPLTIYHTRTLFDPWQEKPVGTLKPL